MGAFMAESIELANRIVSDRCDYHVLVVDSNGCTVNNALVDLAGFSFGCNH